MFGPKMFLLYPDHRYDDAFMNQDDLIEPVNLCNNL